MRSRDRGKRGASAAKWGGHAPEEGSYLVLGAVLLVALFIAAGVGVDVSRRYRLEQSLQDIADAAALAGAQALPDTAAARRTAIEYIRQHVGGPTTDTAAFYTPDDSDIASYISSDWLAGTVGVVVRANWDPIFIPNYLEGASLFTIERYAIAVMARTSSYETIAGTNDNSPGSRFALFVGDTGAFTSSSTGNNMQIIGSAHFNHCAEVSGIGSEIDSGSTFEATCLIGGITGTTEVPTNIVQTPAVSDAALVYDITLDISDPNQAAYYTPGVERDIVLSTGPDLIYGNGNDVLLRDNNGNAVKATYNGLVGGFPDWTVASQNPKASVSGSGGTFNTGIGVGVDMKIVGSANFAAGNASAGGTQNYWKGSLETTGKLTLNGNNAEFRTSTPTEAVAGLDNASLAIYAGSSMTATDLTMDNSGNVFNVYGVLYTPGTVLWTGNMSNPASSDPAPPGTFDTDPDNGFIQGQLICATLSTDNGGGLLGNNIKIWYDGILAGGLPVTNAVTPPRLGTPTVYLVE